MVKDIYNINKNTLSYGTGYVYSLQYPIVWCTKYCRQVLKKELWGGHLWNPSCRAVTVSDRSREQIKHYIQNQKEE